MTKCIISTGLYSYDTGGKQFFFHPSWPVFYEDNHLLVLYKPSGLLTQGDLSKEPCLLDLAKQWIKIKYEKPGNVFLGLVHRLDRAVAGVMLFAKTSKAAARIAEQFKNRLVEKFYLAVVEGIVEKNSDLLVHTLRPGRLKTAVALSDDPDIRRAELWYEVLDRSRRLRRSLLKIKLFTGRKHQIRAQLSFIGHPVLGDLLYGSSTSLKFGTIALFSHKIVFMHPTKKIPLSIISPLPASWPWDGSVSKDKNLFWAWDEIKEFVETQGLDGTGV